MNLEVYTERQMTKPNTVTSNDLPKGENDSGLTLIECLVAIIVIGITAVVVAPVIAISVATRTQSQRAEQAFQLAQAEVNRVKFVVANNDTYTVSAATVAAADSVDQFPAIDPPGDININTYSTTADASTAKPLDVDGDGTTDYAAQIFRTEGVSNGTTPVAFDLGVRIYDARIFPANPADLSTEQARIGLTSGEGQGGTRPLSVIYTSVIKSDEENSLCDYYEFIDDTASAPTQC